VTCQDAYLAGIIDGEGCIFINKAARPDCASPSYWLGLRVGNTDHRLMEWLSRAYGGRVRPMRVVGNRRPAWEWSINGPPAASALRSARPHMIIKARQADIAIAFQERVSSRPAGRLAEAEVARRESDRLALQAEKR
jgi:hypothetical protein